ncbi:MAG: 2OG-Fe(II) oxygenase [Pseudomonadota bacterium]
MLETFDSLGYKIEPRPNAKDWWVGDGNSLPLLGENQEHPSLLIVKDAINPSQCKTLIDCYERNYKELAEHTGVEFWDGRYIQFHDIISHEVDAVRIMQQIRHFANLTIINEFAVGEPVYSDCSQLVRWHAGLEMKPHADNLKSDGSPNATSHRTYSSILYLNDDYEGGHTYYPGLGVRIAPKAGSLLLFGAGYEHVHGVTKITSGLRYTYSGWFTDDIGWRDEKSLIVV